MKTPYWCVLDSDDYIRPEHISTLVEARSRIQEPGLWNVGAKALAVLKVGSEKVVPAFAGGWTKRLWDKPTDMQRVYRQFYSYRRQWGGDSRLLKCGVWEEALFDIPATYLYNLGAAYHVSDQMRPRPNHPKGELPIITPQYHGKPWEWLPAGQRFDS